MRRCKGVRAQLISEECLRPFSVHMRHIQRFPSRDNSTLCIPWGMRLFKYLRTSSFISSRSNAIIIK